MKVFREQIHIGGHRLCNTWGNVIWLEVGAMYKYGSFGIPYARVNLLHKFSSF
jgi:hypothetical protein